MSDVFISYSRRDIDFVRHLFDHLTARDREAWADWQDIPPTADWLAEIYHGIEAADSFLFIISPDSVASEICTLGIEPQTTVKKPPQDLSREKEAPNIKGQSLYVTFEGRAGPDPRNANQGQISIGLHRIIKAEGPMFTKRAYDIYLRSGGSQRMGGELKRTMNKTLQYAINKELVEIADELGKGGLIYSVVRNSKNYSSQSRTSQFGRNFP